MDFTEFIICSLPGVLGLCVVFFAMLISEYKECKKSEEDIKECKNQEQKTSRK